MIMQIAYFSKTNNTERFINKLETDVDKINIEEGVPQDNYILITPTYNFGQIPEEVTDFLEKHGNRLIGVIACGNKNWGSSYGQAGNKISEQYDVPLLHKLELSGNKKDKEIVDNVIQSMI